MIRLAADEDINRRIVHGLRRRLPSIDLVRVQEAGLAATKDPAVLEWAAKETRVLVTHDKSTMIGFAYDRIKQGRPMRGLIVVRQDLSLATVIEDLFLIAELSLESDWEDKVRYLPL